MAISPEVSGFHVRVKGIPGTGEGDALIVKLSTAFVTAVRWQRKLPTSTY
jgi:hypothetical protein